MDGTDSGLEQWIVLLEAADEGGHSTIDHDDFRRMIASWAVAASTTLYSPSRYALQATVVAADASIALAIALSSWRNAVRRASLPEWELVRVEILTPNELELELRAAEHWNRPDMVRASASGSEGVEAEALLRRALHDGVTGLPNREAFVDEVRRALQAPLAGDAVRAVVAVALDAPPEPDGLLQRPGLLADIARHLMATVRRDDTVARIGATEFAALVTLSSSSHTERLAERFVHSIHSAGDRRRHITASVGVATAATADDPDQLLLAAELAMAAARRQGGDRYVHFAGRFGQDAPG